jgi:predicted PurR-regulated permease PerM
MLLFTGIILAQVSVIIQDLPRFEEKTNELLTVLKNYVEARFDIPIEKQTAILQNETRDFSRSIRQYSTQMLTGSVKLMAGMAITLAFTYLMLFHKEKYYDFFLNMNKNGSLEEKEKILGNIAKVGQRYLTGRAISIFILFVLYVIALWATGIEGALLLAAIGALVNIIPYIGPLLAGIFPFVMAMVTKDSIQPAIWVVILFSVIQGIDNYFITPYVLGGEVSLSALATIVFIICGGFVWGVAGMILFIPMLSIVKIIFDAVPAMQPYGNLIGDTGDRPSANFFEKMKKMFGKRR